MTPTIIPEQHSRNYGIALYVHVFSLQKSFRNVNSVKLLSEGIKCELFSIGNSDIMERYAVKKRYVSFTDLKIPLGQKETQN